MGRQDRGGTASKRAKDRALLHENVQHTSVNGTYRDILHNSPRVVRDDPKELFEIDSAVSLQVSFLRGGAGGTQFAGVSTGWEGWREWGREGDGVKSKRNRGPK